MSNQQYYIIGFSVAISLSVQFAEIAENYRHNDLLFIEKWLYVNMSAGMGDVAPHPELHKLGVVGVIACVTITLWVPITYLCDPVNILIPQLHVSFHAHMALNIR